MLILQVGTKPLRRVDDLQELRRRGVNREYAGTGAEAMEFLRLYRFDALVLDLNLRDMSGHDLIRRIRAGGCQSPILAVTEGPDPAPRVKALDLGADDVLDAFCAIDELMARLRAVVRRSSGHAKSVLTAGPLQLCLDSREVTVSGRALHLTPKEYALLELLMLKRGVSLSKGACLNHLYGAEEEPEPKTVDVIVCRLRKKLSAAGLPTLVQNVWGCGYKLSEPSAPAEPAPATPRQGARIGTRVGALAAA